MGRKSEWDLLELHVKHLHNWPTIGVVIRVFVKTPASTLVSQRIGRCSVVTSLNLQDNINEAIGLVLSWVQQEEMESISGSERLLRYRTPSAAIYTQLQLTDRKWMGSPVVMPGQIEIEMYITVSYKFIQSETVFV